MLFKFFRREGFWRLWANMCVFKWRADMHSSFKKQKTRLRAAEWLRLGGWMENILRLWGWATTKGVFGSKNQAAWVWTAGDTDSDLLTDDDQFGRKCSEPVTICRRELWGRSFGVQDCSYLTLMIWRWFSTKFEVLLGNGGVVWARFLGRQRGSFLWWSASGILQASRAKGELFWWSAGELSFNLKFLNFQLLFHPYGFGSDWYMRRSV